MPNVLRYQKHSRIKISLLSLTRTPFHRSRKKSQHSIHKLPPRERLEKYYEAREQLNNLYRQHKDLAQAEKNNDEKIRYTQLAEVYKNASKNAKMQSIF